MNNENRRRTERAAKILIQAGYKTDDLYWQSAISDAITDLCHLANSHEIDMKHAYEVAQGNFESECEEDLDLGS